MFYVAQLHAGHWYVCEYTQESQRGLRVPFELNHAYTTKDDAETARQSAEHLNRLAGRS